MDYPVALGRARLLDVVPGVRWGGGGPPPDHLRRVPYCLDRRGSSGAALTAMLLGVGGGGWRGTSLRRAPPASRAGPEQGGQQQVWTKNFQNKIRLKRESGPSQAQAKGCACIIAATRSLIVQMGQPAVYIPWNAETGKLKSAFGRSVNPSELGRSKQHIVQDNNDFIASESDQHMLRIKQRGDELDMLSASVRRIGAVGFTIHEELLGQVWTQNFQNKILLKRESGPSQAQAKGCAGIIAATRSLIVQMGQPVVYIPWNAETGKLKSAFGRSVNPSELGRSKQHIVQDNNDFIASESDQHMLWIKERGDELDMLSATVQRIGAVGLTIQEELLGQVDELEKEISVAERHPAYYGLNEAEIGKMRKWISTACSQGVSIRRNVGAGRDKSAFGLSVNPSEVGRSKQHIAQDNDDQHMLLMKQKDDELDMLGASVRQIGGAGLTIHKELVGQDYPKLNSRFREVEENVKVGSFNALIELLCQAVNVTIDESRCLLKLEVPQDRSSAQRSVSEI